MAISSTILQRIRSKDAALSPHAARLATTRGRERPEAADASRDAYAVDRERIVRSKAFRRLMHKTQVFLAPRGDHYLTRLTHTMEVSLLARAVARNLNLNEELTEAVCMGHDLGHAPFGHLGEATLAEVSGSGFRHNRQSVRVIELLENGGKGLNLTWEVRQGILRHSKGRGGIEGQAAEGLDTLEGQIAKIADALAYVTHDTEDAVRAGMITEAGIPASVTGVLGRTRAEWIPTLVRDLTETSWAAAGEPAASDGSTPIIRMSPRVSAAANGLRDFLFARVYEPASANDQAERAREIIRLLYRHFLAHPASVPDDYSIPGEPPERRALDYISGMTDGYALLVAEAVKPGCTTGFWEQGVPLSLPR